MVNAWAFYLLVYFSSTTDFFFSCFIFVSFLLFTPYQHSCGLQAMPDLSAQDWIYQTDGTTPDDSLLNLLADLKAFR